MKRNIKTAGDIVDLFGSQTALAQALSNLDGLTPDVSQKTTQNWVHRDSIPREWLYPIYLVAKQRRLPITMTMLLKHAARGVMTKKALT